MKTNKIYIGLGIIGFVLVLLLVVGIVGRENDALRISDLKKLSLTEKVDRLEAHLNEEDISYAAIFGDRLIYGNDHEEIEIELPSDQFYLSFAPYLNHTHPCVNHNLITCRSELVNEIFHVVVQDANGLTIKEGEITTYSNGFAGIWLPKNIVGTITVAYGDLTATANIETYPTSPTCLTTLELQ